MRAILHTILLTTLLFTGFKSFSQQFDSEQLLDMIQNQRYKEAAAYIKSVYPAEISDDKILSRLAYCNYMAGNLPDAERNFGILLAKDTTNRTALNYLAGINEKRGNYLQTRRYYEKMLLLDSINFLTYKKLADVCDNLRDTTGWLRNLKKANGLNPREPDIAYDYARLLIKRKRYGLVDSVLSIAMATDSLNILLINTRMNLAHKQEDYKLSVKMARKAIDLGDNAGQTFNLLGIGCYYLRQYKDCVAAFSILELTSNSNETTYYYTALAYRQLGNILKSNEYLARSVREGISNNIPVYYQEMSVNDEQQKKYRAGINHLDKAETFDSRNVFNYARARIYDQKLEDRKNALKYYKKYVDLYNEERDNNKACYHYSLARIKDLSPAGTSASAK
ncbi:tetratricopeptide repeat protein [Hufsiella ginkgonis]|uniref:Tetratricopeptide repeat protein n=1 Tax=Hufsiella ginkgonis TaxID=2695274 RepID=A0A7K1XZN5_9SPHI|nr:hypothetical protein [Hufsiella ginkgonis]MXV16430.1 hypothetical protein [Hufsiella ginkgonis]